MKTAKFLALTLAAATAAAALAAPPVPPTPAGVANILYARQFTLQEGYKHLWSNEQPTVTTGWIVVLEVNPDYVYPRQTAEPVLYVGNQTAQRINGGFQSGRVIALVPGTVDLKTAQIWFGSPELPERVTNATFSQQRTAASNAGIKPFAAEKVDAALKAGGPALKVRTAADLNPTLADLIERYSPQERESAQQLRAAR